MRGPHNLIRLIRVGATLERTGAMNEVLNALNANLKIKIAARVIGWPVQWLGLKGEPSQPPILRAIMALGPSYIKFGQLLSTRPDIVGKKLSDELSVLQERIKPFSTERVIQTIAEEFGQPHIELFSEFSEPIAAASIAQVHQAVLKDCGSKVAVKIRRPGIERAFQRDIDAFYLVARLVSLLSPSTKRLRPRDIIEHFEGVVLNELDLRLEASACGEFAELTQKDEGILVPKIRWHLSDRRVVTMDWVQGIKLTDMDALLAAGHNTKLLAQRLLQMFLRTALRDGYFHADMHQGNLRIAEDGKIVVMDFGIMGRIDEYTRRVYAEIILGFIRRDYKKVARIHFEAGYVPADQNVDQFAQALRSVGEPIFGADSTQISMGKLLSHLFEVTERFGMETRTELILLQRTMVVVEGVARSLDPHLNIWTTARPVVEDYVKTYVGPAVIVRDITQTAGMLFRLGPKMPLLIEKLNKKIEQSEEKDEPQQRLIWFMLGLSSALAVALLIAI